MARSGTGDQALSDGISGEFDPVVDLELVHGVRQMGLHRLDADAHARGNLLLLEPCSDEGNDLLDGGPGADIIGGGRGNDVLVSVEPFDTVRGGSETDIIDASPIRVT